MKEFAFKNGFGPGMRFAVFILWRLFGFLVLRKNVVPIFKIVKKKLGKIVT